MSIEVRGISADELDELVNVTHVAFGEELTAERLQDARDGHGHERAVAAVDEGHIVGSAGAFTFTLTVPGGAQVPVAGVTWVGVLPTHRRRGVLNGMMRHQLDDVAARGEPIAVLTASEATIYNRYGYGVATRTAEVVVDTVGGVPFVAEPEVGGRIRLVDKDEAAKLLPGLREAFQRHTVGELTEAESRWDVWFRDRESWREDDASPRYYVVHEDDAGTPDGYAAYRVVDRWKGYRARNQVQLENLYAVDREVEAALWRFILDLDLKVEVKVSDRRLDDPMRMRFVDTRRYWVKEVGDLMWVRPLDIPAALQARTYAADGELVLGVDDAFRPASSGRYRLVVDTEGRGACERVGNLHDGDADCFLTVDALGSLYLGDVTPSLLAAAGKLRPSSPEALARLDRALATPRAPYCTLHF